MVSSFFPLLSSVSVGFILMSGLLPSFAAVSSIALVYSSTFLSDKTVHVFGVWPLGRVHLG